jgi:hypothetical protein
MKLFDLIVPHERSKHMKSSTDKVVAAFVIGLFLSVPDPVLAFQSHTGYEGLCVHQLAHVFFAVTMGILAYWLQANRFTDQRGWRLVQISCLLFIIWNMDAFFGHWVEHRIPDGSLIGPPDWTQRIYVNVDWVTAYYVLKMDHLWCVPAIVCLFAGIRLLFLSALDEEGRNG